MNCLRIAALLIVLLCSSSFAEPEEDGFEGAEESVGPEGEAGSEAGESQPGLEAGSNEEGGEPGGASKLPIDCQDVQRSGTRSTGVYAIFPKGSNGFKARCDMETAGGGWTVIQRRISNSNFYRGWTEYQTGFGDLNTNYWLGLLQMHLLTKDNWYELRFDMVGPTGQKRYAQYDMFSIADVTDKYRLAIGKYSGNAGDSLKIHNGYQFTTFDNDNDIHSQNCAKLMQGAFWYEKCHQVNINGLYHNKRYAKGIVWYTFTGHFKSLREVEMKIRRHPGPPRPSPVAAQGMGGDEGEGMGEDAGEGDMMGTD